MNKAVSSNAGFFAIRLGIQGATQRCPTKKSELERCIQQRKVLDSAITSLK